MFSNFLRMFSKVTADFWVILKLCVFLPMVLQVRKTMVLQRIELGGKGILSHFCLFGLSVAWMRKHGFAEKLH